MMLTMIRVQVQGGSCTWPGVAPRTVLPREDGSFEKRACTLGEQNSPPTTPHLLTMIASKAAHLPLASAIIFGLLIQFAVSPPIGLAQGCQQMSAESHCSVTTNYLEAKTCACIPCNQPIGFCSMKQYAKNSTVDRFWSSMCHSWKLTGECTDLFRQPTSHASESSTASTVSGASSVPPVLSIVSGSPAPAYVTSTSSPPLAGKDLALVNSRGNIPKAQESTLSDSNQVRLNALSPVFLVVLAVSLFLTLFALAVSLIWTRMRRNPPDAINQSTSEPESVPLTGLNMRCEVSDNILEHEHESEHDRPVPTAPPADREDDANRSNYSNESATDFVNNANGDDASANGAEASATSDNALVDGVSASASRICVTTVPSDWNLTAVERDQFQNAVETYGAIKIPEVPDVPSVPPERR